MNPPLKFEHPRPFSALQSLNGLKVSRPSSVLALVGQMSSSMICEADFVSAELWRLKNKHTTAQSSILEDGYLVFHARTARSTTSCATVDRFLAEATTLITSSLLSTSQT
nr:uncharacterized protein LOC111432437 [Ipomoea batatas]